MPTDSRWSVYILYHMLSIGEVPPVLAVTLTSFLNALHQELTYGFVSRSRVKQLYGLDRSNVGVDLGAARSPPFSPHWLRARAQVNSYGGVECFQARLDQSIRNAFQK